MSFSARAVWKEFSHSKIGMTGVAILLILFTMSIVAFVTIPLDSFKTWNDPASWLLYPKSAQPAWVNYFQSEKIPEHLILSPVQSSQQLGSVNVLTDSFAVNYQYDGFPSDFIYQYAAKYSGSPLLQITVTRPDGTDLQLVSTSLPFASNDSVYSSMIFSTQNVILKNIADKRSNYAFSLDGLSSEKIIFSKLDENKILKGLYVFHVHLYDVSTKPVLEKSRLILGGQVYGVMGTDELRRDLSIGLLWGTPLALFIGITVSIGSVVIGLIYGVYAGYKGSATDEVLMRFNDIIYAMPALPLLIILAVTIGNSIFLMVGFLVIFGWVGIAKVSRSMAMQIKTLQYVEAAQLMGQKNYKIIFKHILPQLLPYAFASIAISVPGAITTEAGLSFLGLGDPTFPTWGQILHDASSYSAAARGMWWWIMPPGIMIAVTGLAFVFMGHAMDGIVNPKLRQR
ncbi:ABC transporter permease [Candidatus Nitrosotalea okcheonensis]|uniref:Binding-protein-dependent transporter inner membrane component n=1 Tax=Candidatus Nitrosotalea okcheonensis TaxID=1903276 RepID=A0A2H1FEG4_9ARCH|nr:ABC transporter permease [Candidatus Nitrosotalea okcheonensis]SMH71176.1 Binding-protein-dependent transporter inner membrane component [Candidatus Nitrosotalea okcheonensis]